MEGRREDRVDEGGQERRKSGGEKIQWRREWGREERVLRVEGDEGVEERRESVREKRERREESVREKKVETERRVLVLQCSNLSYTSIKRTFTV